jgi:hypothetical protein
MEILNITGGNATKEFNDFFSPLTVGKEILSHISALNSENTPLTVFEPSVGTGQLIWPLLEGKEKVIISINEIQDEYLHFVIDKAESLNYKVKVVDNFITISN